MRPRTKCRWLVGELAVVLVYGCADEGGGTRDEGTFGPPISTTDTVGRPTSGDGDTDAGGTTADDDGEGEAGGGPSFDVGEGPGLPEECGDGTGDGEVVSYIWIANTEDLPNTVSKIDTRTMVEVGRYQTRADGYGSPSRTSVALSGHVAVANRSGGVTKFLAYGCPGATSPGGPDTELPWEMETCRAWSVDMAYTSQRPVAWTPGVFNEDTCRWDDEYLWVGGANGGNSGVVLLLDGDDGTILETVAVPELVSGNFGPYGGAVDANGDFWFSQVEGSTELVHVPFDDPQNYAVHHHSINAYGLQVDHKGRPWMCGRDGWLARFTPSTGAWDYGETGAEMWGCMPDSSFMWVGGSVGTISGVDLETMAVVHNFALPGIDNNDIHGTSIDFDGFVWGVSRGTTAARVDITTGEVQIVGGLNGPYTYSDMTGFALSNVVAPEG